jgi:predicted MFS family arabinose efflux permease
MNYIILLGASAIIGSSAGGFISTIIGLKNTFLICSVFCAIALIGFVLATLIYPEFKKVENKIK